MCEALVEVFGMKPSAGAQRAGDSSHADIWVLVSHGETLGKLTQQKNNFKRVNLSNVPVRCEFNKHI